MAQLSGTGRLSIGPTPFGVVAALLCTLPVMALLVMALSGGGEHLQHLAETQLSKYAFNSLLLVVATIVGTLLLGIPTAWLIARHDFPGRRFFMIALPLPLAMPSYIAAYAWMAMTMNGGPIHETSGGLFPTVSGIAGAAFVFSICLYPYIFLLARQAFENMGMKSFETGRMLGTTPWRAFFSVSLPLARPAIVAGLALVVMETLADYGTVDFLGTPTFTVGILRAWISFGDPEAAARLAMILLVLTLLVFGGEKLFHRGKRVADIGGRTKPARRIALSTKAGMIAIFGCAIPVIFGLVAPVWMLAKLALETEAVRSPLEALQGTLLVASLSALLAVLVGLGAAYAARSGGWFAKATVQAAHVGYAVPGAVAALGVIAILAVFQNLLDVAVGPEAPLLAGGGIIALLFAYQARFAAAAIGPCESALARVTPSMDHAARSLGASRWAVIRRIHAPMAFGGIATAALLVFIEVMKELPATMILRPLDFETLAVSAHHFASDERLAQAALPSLLLVGLGIPIMLLVSWLMTRQQQKGTRS